MLNQEMQEIRIVAAACHLNVTAFAAYVDYEGMDLDEAVHAFEDHYAGTYDSLEAWAEEYADGTGLLDGVPQDLRYYFDFASWAKDQELNGYIWSIDTTEGVAIFWH